MVEVAENTVQEPIENDSELEELLNRIKQLDTEKLAILRDSANQERKSKIQEEKNSKPKSKKSHYKCENCDCGGFIAMDGLTFKCLNHEKNATKAPSCNPVNTWEIVGRKKNSEKQSETQAPEEAKPSEPEEQLDSAA